MLNNDFGNLFKINGTDRKCIVVSAFKVTEIVMLQVYPISKSIFLAGDTDFIFTSETDPITPLMAESWNPLIVKNNALISLNDKIDDIYLEYFKKFVIFKYMGLKIEEKKIFTGPPLTSKTDIRCQFRQSEFSYFSAIRQTSSISLLTAEKLITYDDTN